MNEMEICYLWKKETMKTLEGMIKTLDYCFKHTKQVSEEYKKQYKIAKSNRDTLEGIKNTLEMCGGYEILVLRKLLNTEKTTDKLEILNKYFGSNAEGVELLIALVELLRCIYEENN